MSRIAQSALNPILLKELRQAVRSRFVSGAYCLFLLVLTVVTGSVLMAGELRSAVQPGALFGAGRGLFQALFVPLTLVCILFVPTYSGLRLAAERGEAHLDLQFTTQLSPGAILRGKFMAALTLVTLMSSAALPFLALTFRLGGIDLPSALLSLLALLLVSALSVLATLLLAALPGNRFWRALLALSCVSALFWAVTMTNMAAVGIVESGAGSYILTSEFWQVAGVIAVGALLLAGGLHVLAVALISPPAANRALPIRVWATLSWLAWGVLMTALAFVHKEEGFLMGWIVPGLLLSLAVLPLAAGERPDVGRRVRLSIPRRLPARLAAFPFFSGAASGTLWALALGLATLLIGQRLMNRLDPDWAADGETFPILYGMLAYAFAYSQSGLLLWRAIGHRWLSRGHVWVIVLLLASLGCLLPLLVGLATGTLGRTPYGTWSPGNPFALFDSDHRTRGALFAVAWCALLVVPLVPWILRAWRDFKPPSPESPPAPAK